MAPVVETMLRPNPIRAAWGGVHVRNERLAGVRSRFEQSAVEALAEFRREAAAHSEDEIRAVYQRVGGARRELLLFAEATLMFADATTNAIAEAIRMTWGIDPGGRPWGFSALLRAIRRGDTDSRTPDVGSLLDRLHSVHVQVNVPRQVLAVHPPGNISAAEFRFADGTAENMRIGAWNRPPEAEDVELERLRHTVTSEAAIPEVHAAGELLVIWAIDNADKLSGDARDQLKRYVWRHGCSVSPKHLADVTTALVRDVTELFGWPRRAFSPVLSAS